MIAAPPPQVLHIGFSKCASTYLRAVFRAQPRVHLVFKSGFFTPMISGAMTFERYQSLFTTSPGTVNVESDEHLTLPGIHPELGVRATTLSDFEVVADRIKRYLPHVKLILVVRNQASLIVSRYSEFLITGGSLSFDDFATRLVTDKDGTNRHFQNYYARVIEILENRFPRSNLLILVQELMRENQQATDSAIAHSLSLDRLEPPASGLRSERRSLSILGMSLLRHINRLLVRRGSFGDIAPDTRVPLPLYRNLVRAVRAFDFYVLNRISSTPSSLLSESRKRAIMSHFRDDNLRLQERVGRDLKPHGYL